VGGDLEPAQAAEVETHLEGCAPCEEAFQACRRARSAYRSGAHEAPADLDLWPALSARLEAERAPAPAPVPAAAAPRAPRLLRLAGGLAAAAALVLAVRLVVPGVAPAPVDDPGPVVAEESVPAPHPAQPVSDAPRVAEAQGGLERVHEPGLGELLRHLEDQRGVGAAPAVDGPWWGVPVDPGGDAVPAGAPLRLR
jgi:anti-sigma factor RsiW